VKLGKNRLCAHPNRKKDHFLWCYIYVTGMGRDVSNHVTEHTNVSFAMQHGDLAA